MKGLILLSLMGLVACNTSGSGNKNPGQAVWQFENLDAAPGDKTNIGTICQAIAFKSSTLSSQIGQTFTFSYAQKGCTDDLSPYVDVSTILRSQSGSYVYDAGATSSFPFTQIDTFQTDYLAKLCENVVNLQNPFFLDSSGRNAVKFTTNNSNYCRSTDDSRCLAMDFATTDGGNGYQTHTTQFIKYKISGPNRGHAIERTLISTPGCARGFNQKTAILK